jgi:hypothetical protein
MRRCGTPRQLVHCCVLTDVEEELERRAISEVPTRRRDLFAFEVDGKIHEKDIEWMARRLKSAFDSLGTVDIIIVMKNWDGIDFSAVFDTESLSAQGRAASHVRKYAVVGAPGWAEAMINMFSPLSPVEAKTFDLEDEKKAWAWVES